MTADSAGATVPRLAFPAGGGRSAALPAEAVGDVRTWNVRGGADVFGYEARGSSWIHVTRAATFRFTPGGRQVEAFAAAGATRAAIRDVYERSVLPLVLQSAGTQVLHASAVVDGAGVTALAGVSGSGKSTLAVALAEDGVSLWADDAVAFVPYPESVASIPLPFSPRLRAAAAAHLAAPIPRRDAGPTALNNVVLLAQSAIDDRARLERVRGANAFTALLPHAYCFSLRDPAENRKLSDDYLELARTVPVWRLRFPAGLEQLPAVVDLLRTSVLSS